MELGSTKTKYGIPDFLSCSTVDTTFILMALPTSSTTYSIPGEQNLFNEIYR